MKSNSHFRIVSLVPSLTETLCGFGLEEQLVGCTSFCCEPKSLRTRVPSVGGTKDASFEKIVALQPTHIVVNTEENTADLISKLREFCTSSGCQLVETFLDRPNDNLQLIKSLSETFAFTDQATAWCDLVEQRLQTMIQKQKHSRRFNFVYFIWMNPWMVAGDKTYISRCLELIGGQNSIQTGVEPEKRYPVLDLNDPCLNVEPICLFSSEPFPFRNRHIEIFNQSVHKPIRALKVNGQELSWYGIRFKSTLDYLETLIEKINSI